MSQSIDLAEVVRTQRYSVPELQARRLCLDLRAYARAAWPIIDKAPLKWGAHMDAVCDHLVYVSLGDIRFLIVNQPPRSSKSTLGSVIWPTWDWTTRPERQWLTGSYTLQLSTRDALKSRRLLDSDWYQARWPLPFMSDEKLKRSYSNARGGRRVVTSTDSAATGEGGDILLLDDPHNAKEVESEDQRQTVIDFWDGTFSSRMNDQNIGAWVVMGQMTHPVDLFNHIRETAGDELRDIVQLVLPNEFEPKRRCVTRLPRTRKVIFKDQRKKAGDLLFSDRLNAEATTRLKRTLKGRYTLQYQQSKEVEEGDTITRAMWHQWEGEPPEVDEIITCWDTAYGIKQRNDYSARTDWGIFRHCERRMVPVVDRFGNPTGVEQSITLPERNCAILLGAWQGKVPPFKLRRLALEHYERVKPDKTLIEMKVSGIDVIHEFRRLGVRGVKAINIDHGGRVKMDMDVRMNMIQPIFEDGCVYYLPTKTSKDVIENICGYPNVAHDDYCSTVTIALQWLRRRGELHLWEDEKAGEGEIRLFKATKRNPIYG